MRRVDLKREEGVAMTEFALIAPAFMLIVVGMLLFGRVFFYWIETNHLASETARWAAVDRNPYDTTAPYDSPTLQRGARAGGQTLEFENDTRVCIDFPEGAAIDLGDPVRVKVQQQFTIFGGWSLQIRGSSTMRIERLAGLDALGDDIPLTYTAGADPAGTCS
jgi:hypothetical protein